jgi:hypothetical protein
MRRSQQRDPGRADLPCRGQAHSRHSRSVATAIAASAGRKNKPVRDLADDPGHQHHHEITHLMSQAGNWPDGLRWIARRVKPSRRHLNE